MKMNAWRYAVYGMVIILLIAIAVATMPAASSAPSGPHGDATVAGFGPFADHPLRCLADLRAYTNGFTYSAAAVLAITPYTHLQASTYNTGSFRLDMSSTTLLVELRIDLEHGHPARHGLRPLRRGRRQGSKRRDRRPGRKPESRRPRLRRPPRRRVQRSHPQLPQFQPRRTILVFRRCRPTSIAGVSAPGPGEAGSVAGWN